MRLAAGSGGSEERGPRPRQDDCILEHWVAAGCLLRRPIIKKPAGGGLKGTTLTDNGSGWLEEALEVEIVVAGEMNDGRNVENDEADALVGRISGWL